MNKEKFELYKKDKENGLEPITFQPAEFGKFIASSLLAGVGIGLIINVEDIISVVTGIIFVVLGMYGMASSITSSRKKDV